MFSVCRAGSVLVAATPMPRARGEVSADAHESRRRSTGSWSDQERRCGLPRRAARRAESTAASVDASVPPFSSRQQARAQQIPILARIEPAPKGLRYQQKVGARPLKRLNRHWYTLTVLCSNLFTSTVSSYQVLTISRLVESLMPRCALISSRYEARGSVPVSTSVQKRETRKERQRHREERARVRDSAERRFASHEACDCQTGPRQGRTRSG